MQGSWLLKRKSHPLCRKSKYKCLMTDVWTSNQNDSYITVTIHLLTPGWQIVSYSLGLAKTEERHTAENLPDELEKVMDAWDLPEAFAVVWQCRQRCSGVETTATMLFGALDIPVNWL